MGQPGAITWNLSPWQMTTCVVCQKPGSSKCSKCKSVYYCGVDCQVKHWQAGHKEECNNQLVVAKPASVDKDLEFLESLTDEKLRQMDPADIPKLLAQLRNQLDESRKRGQELEEQVARRKQILKQLDAAK